jgi:hypothetical protein
VVEDALRGADCYELLLPQHVADFAALLTSIGDRVARPGMRTELATERAAAQPVGASWAERAG